MPPELPAQFDHYTLETNAAGRLTVLSSDGTGRTHRAKDTRTGQPVIVRIFSERLLADSSVQKEFVEHAKLLIELDHPSITRIVDTGQHADQFFYVLEDPRGQTVEEWVDASGPLDVAHTLRLHLQLSEALLAVRTKPGLLSRVWPRSLMITGQGQDTQIHLLAQNLVAPSEEEEQPEFLAPEILAGHQDTAQASLYSIGATLYYMLTGKSPYPSGLTKEDLLELKSKRLPDMAILPEASPVTLLRQVLDTDPRNRPKSLMEWDRALQRFIRFTPADTGPIPVRVEPVADAPHDPEPDPMAEPAALTPFHSTKRKATLEPAADTTDPDLDKAKIHTQRLSVELTKRVQKELALTEQLQTLESELKEERTRVQELTSKQALPERDELARLRAERSKIDSEWSKLQNARQNLEKEQHEFLKKTQRFSVGQLSTPTAPSEKSELTETQRVTSKPRFFRLGRKAKAEKIDKATAKTDDTSKPTSSKPATATKAEPTPQAKPEPKDSKVVTFKDPKAAKPPEVPAKLAPTAQEKTATKPQKAAQRTSKPTSRLAADTAVPPASVAKPSAPSKATTRKAKPPTPQYKPLPGAWLALGILAAVIALGLFLAYRTFFSRQDSYLLGTLTPDKEPTVVNLNPSDEPAPFEPLIVPNTTYLQTDASERETITVEAANPPTEPAPRPTREASVNEELRVDMKAFNNFLLIQDEEWKEVLHGVKNLQLQADKYSEEELSLIHQELYDDLERKAQLRKDSEKDLQDNPDFKKLYDFVKALVPEQPDIGS